MNSSVKYINDSTITEDDKESKVPQSPPKIKIYRSTIIESQKIRQKEKKRYGYLFLKRAFDIFASILAFILFSPIFLIIAILIKLDSKGKIIYTQTRVGKNGKPFKFYKFRSMVSNSSEVMLNFTEEQKKEFEINFKLNNDPRITKIGKILRKTSLDELPQLYNILKGELTFVGPRPIVEREVYKYGDRAEKFLSEKPGLTGYWQVNGRNDTSYDERIEMDMFYIKNKGIFLDLKIILATFKVVFKGKGAY